MWVFTTGGFVSAVEHRDDPTVVIVRAREKQSLLTMIEVMNKASGSVYDKDDIKSKRPSDYPWRIYVSKEQFRDWVAYEAEHYIAYSNFKNAVTQTRGKKFHDALMRVWTAMLSVEDVARKTYSGYYSSPTYKPQTGASALPVGSTFFKDEPDHPAVLEGLSEEVLAEVEEALAAQAATAVSHGSEDPPKIIDIGDMY